MQIFRCCVTGCITERALTTVAALVAMHLIVLTALYAQLSASTHTYTYVHIGVRGNANCLYLHSMHFIAQYISPTLLLVSALRH